MIFSYNWLEVWTMMENETIFRVMGICMQDAMVMMDNDGRITFWNNAAERIFGWLSWTG